MYLEKIKEMEIRKRQTFIGSSIIGIFMCIFVSPFVGIIPIVIGIITGVNWFKYRAKNGLRF